MPDLASLVRGRTTWIVLGAISAVFVAQLLVVDRHGSVVAVAVLGVVPIVVLAVAATVAIRRNQYVAVAGLVAALTPAVLSGLADGQRHAALAVGAAVVGAGAAWFRRSEPGLVATTVIGFVVVATTLWFASGDRRTGPARIDDIVHSALGAVSGSLTLRVAVVAWVACVVTVISAAVVAGGRHVALVPLVATAIFAILAWGIESLDEPVAPAGGVWLLTGAVAYVGAGAELRPRVDRRLGRAAIVLVAASWLVSVVQQARANDVGTVRMTVAAVLPIVLVGALWWRSAAGRRPPGVNVVGYFDRTSGLGERARTLAEVLRAGGVAVSEWPVEATVSPRRDRTRVPHGTPTLYDTTIAVVTALEFPGLAHTHADVIGDVERVIGYWFWELADVPPTHAPAIAMVDEIWTPTAFVRDAYQHVATCPVRLVPLPIAPPDRAAPPALDRDAFVFLTSFDHLSVMERKNPLAVVAAFRRAFPAGDEPVRLIVKSINAEHAPQQHARLAAAVAGDPRIELRDEVLGDDEFVALIASSHAFVSLHRSEGLGLQPALAMWLGVPVISSSYSGTLDLMDESCALLIPVELVPVVDGGGAYPPGVLWADPDVEVAAEAMRRLVVEPGLARAIGEAGRRRMEGLPSPAQAGRRIRRILGGWAPMHRSGARPSGFGSVRPMPARHSTSDASVAP